MIAQRFRALGWVAGIASAATCLYLTSLQVAAERAELEGVEAKIASARRDMRQLQTEIGTRASLRQLERWNGEVLALQAPRADQYLHEESELASVGSRELQGPAGPPAAVAPAVMMAAAQATPVQAPAPVVLASAAAPAAVPAPAAVTTVTVQRVAFEVPRSKPAAAAASVKPRPTARPARVEPVVRTAAIKPKPRREEARVVVARPRPASAATPLRVASARPLPIRPVLARGVLSDIERRAAAEARPSSPMQGRRR